MRTSAPFLAALLTAASIAGTASATVTTKTPKVAIPCWKTWQSVRDAKLHHTTPAGCGKVHRAKNP